MAVEPMGLTPMSPLMAELGTVLMPDLARTVKLPALRRFTGSCAAETDTWARSRALRRPQIGDLRALRRRLSDVYFFKAHRLPHMRQPVYGV